MSKLTDKQEKFCHLVIELGNNSDAYRGAYSAAKMKAATVHRAACEVVQKPYIQIRLAELRAKNLSHLIDKGAVPIERAIIDELASHFGGVENAKKWVSAVVSREAADLGISMKSILRGSISSASRYAVLNRAGFKCQACGDKPNSCNDVILHIDHIVPSSLGGRETVSNLQALCSLCNLSKGNRFAVNHNE